MDDILARILHAFLGRVDDQMAMRLLVQPIMAAILTICDGIRDAREGRPPYGWSLIVDPAHRGHRFRDGWRSIRILFVIALVLDIVYQVMQLRWVYLVEALIMAETLALVPYGLLRGPVNRIANWHRGRTASRM